jgi:hypothetical protein
VTVVALEGSLTEETAGMTGDFFAERDLIL